MNIQSLIFGFAGLIALVTLPVFLHYLYKKNKEMRFLKYFNNLAEREKLSISQKDMWKDNYLIGIDDSSNKVININMGKDKIQESVIDLSFVENCRIGNINRNVKTQDGLKNVTDRLELVFAHRVSEMSDTILEFYDSEIFMTSDGEFPLIEKWFRIINSKLNRLKK
jgi:hypothetical protein